MITHAWFASGRYSLLCHLHQTPGEPRLGVVLVPPFGWEDVCAYRPLRELASTLAESGIVVLRYDLPATGDSTGSATDDGLLDAWIASVGDAADYLRASTGLTNISVLGVHLGAVLTLAAVAKGAPVDDLALWGGAAQGRNLLRELRAFRNMEAPEFGESASVATTDDSGIEAGGFYLAPATVDALEGLDLRMLPPLPGRRVLVLTRDEFAADKKLVAALQSAGAALEQLPGPGYAAMTAVPHEARLDDNTARNIAEWFSKGESLPRRTPIAFCASPSAEAIALLPQPVGTGFGIITPAPGHLWLIFLNPGAGRHIGPNRLWVDFAREWATRGVPSLRLDLAGVGESEGEQNLDVEGLYNEDLVSQVQTAMDYLQQHHGANQFALIGLCSGAFWAFHAAARNRAVRAAILLNPRLFFWDPEVDRRRERQRNVNAVAKPDAWKRLVRGQVPAERIRSAVRDVLGRLTTSEPAEAEPTQIPAEAYQESLDHILRNGAQLSMIFTEGEPLLRELEEEGHLSDGSPQPFRCIRIRGAGHTFRPLWAQAQLRAIIETELATIVANPAS